MKLTITSIKLRGPLSFFALSARALKVVKQLKPAGCVQFKKQGFWTEHYTMSLWNTEEELRNFARSGAHLEAMKGTAQIASEVRTLTIDADKMPTWKQAKEMLKSGRSHHFNH